MAIMGNRKRKIPVENHKTAAWSNIQQADRISSVAEPGRMQVEQAKEYADENEK